MSQGGDDSELSRAERIAQQRRELPDSPGVYLFHGADGETLYVGKARSIRKRIGSHFSGGDSRLTSRVDRIECLVTATEAEALLAEQSFIKRHRPRFNIRLRDDKSYPYVCVSLDEDYPRVYFTREKHRPGRAYFGPFSSAKRVRETLDLLGKLFQFRTCEGRSISGSSTPVLNQLTSPPAQNALPAPVMISARSGARSASQAKATVSSPIISGLIALKASGRSSVRVPILAPSSISIFSVFSSGGLLVRGSVCVVIALSP